MEEQNDQPAMTLDGVVEMGQRLLGKSGAVKGFAGVYIERALGDLDDMLNKVKEQPAAPMDQLTALGQKYAALGRLIGFAEDEPDKIDPLVTQVLRQGGILGQLDKIDGWIDRFSPKM